MDEEEACPACPTFVEDEKTTPLLAKETDDVEQQQQTPEETIDPPSSRYEKIRDRFYSYTDGPVQFWLGLIVMFLVVLDGAFFFFLLVGWQAMCTPRMNCEPRNWWYNWSIQVLNVLFTYLATVSLPWRVSNAIHLFGKKRSSKPGLGVYGNPTEEIWYHISETGRKIIVALLIMNTLTQYANQATRIIYYNYERQSTWPGFFWTNLFFGLSMACAGVAGAIQIYLEERIRKQNPDRFTPGLPSIIGQYLQVVLCRKKVNNSDVSSADEDPRPLYEREESARGRFNKGVGKLFRVDKTTLDLWGL